jgi:hypothetical protein
LTSAYAHLESLGEPPIWLSQFDSMLTINAQESIMNIQPLIFIEVSLLSIINKLYLLDDIKKGTVAYNL